MATIFQNVSDIRLDYSQAGTRIITEHPHETPLKCIIIDGMVILHSIPDRAKIETMSDLKRAFRSIIEQRTDV